jgi:hypothetical protein
MTDFSRNSTKLSITLSPVSSFTLGISSRSTPVGPLLGLLTTSSPLSSSASDPFRSRAPAGVPASPRTSLNANGSRISLVGVGEFSERGSAGEDIVGGVYRGSIECKVREGPDENASRQRVHSFLVSHMWHSKVVIGL